MLSLRGTRRKEDNPLASRLLDDGSFYIAFLDDLNSAKQEVIIESPFITSKRMAILLPTFRKLTRRGVRLVVNTKPLEEHEPEYRAQAERAIAELQVLDVLVLFTDGHHRKLMIIDRQILYEGSLNVLSQNASCEVMRRIQSEQLATEMLAFLRLEKMIV